MKVMRSAIWLGAMLSALVVVAAVAVVEARQGVQHELPRLQVGHLAGVEPVCMGAEDDHLLPPVLVVDVGAELGCPEEMSLRDVRGGRAPSLAQAPPPPRRSEPLDAAAAGSRRGEAELWQR